MSAKNKEVADGGLKGPSGGVEEGDEAMRSIVAHIASTALDLKGELTPLAEFQIGLREAGARGGLLLDVVHEVCPSGVNPKPWQNWISGGGSPFGDGKLQKTGTDGERPGATMSRGSSRVRAQARKVENLRAKLAAEEDELQYYEAIEKAALHWHVADQLLSIVQPVFAMGPAWTVMRSITGTAPDSHVEELTAFFDGRAKDKEAEKVRAEYAEEAAEIRVALDLFSGHEEFEKRLRGAIKSVVDEFADRHDEVVNSGGRRRSAEKMMSSINPEAAKGYKEVLEGFDTKD